MKAPVASGARDRLPCEANPQVFHPDGVGAHTYDAAKRLCAGCPAVVRESCLRFALEHEERAGVWGGLTPRERRVLRERSGAVPRVAP